ncbi:hypothetical protein [Streptomyces sp. NPDC058891]|uniref:hypothetical protein n=1 Tax=Streptomyces sp. NPDC058891 TaxID=3346667 RepID=UPI0036C29CAF
MAVQPVPCEPGGNSTPVEVTTCCAPSIASTPLCRADGTTILAVVRSGCVECGQAPEDPAVAGWLDTAGAFTPGALPADARPCDAGCVDTVCRTLCDDTDGDGQPDATYRELWCIRADSPAELVLTYQDDPSTPYTPTAPLDCTYGCPETENVQLCDDTGPFLRRYTWLNGAATFEDVELDGQTPHIVTGTVTSCAAQRGEECAAPTTPAATLGLCLADGTPIAVVVTRDCDGIITRDGWLNLTTGAYATGDPPAGTIACGDSRSITTNGTFCDVDPDGNVLGLVLVEYQYAADGSIASVRLVDAITGATYTPRGQVTTCPAGVEQPERDILQLCDTAPDGTITPFVRDYTRDENGQITGHTDYLLDGTPYTAAGTVGRCAQECQDCQTVVLCDTDANPPSTIAGTDASGTLSNGVAWTSTGPSALPPTRQGDGAAWWGSAVFPNPAIPTNLWTFDQPVNVDFSVVMNWSTGTAAGENQVQLPAGAVPISLPPGYTYDRATSILHADSTLTACTVATPTRAAGARFRVTGVTSLSLRYLGTRATNVPCRVIGHWVFGALDVSLGGQFLRTVCRDCTGAVTSTTDTLLDGTTPYTPIGVVGVCDTPPDEQCGPMPLGEVCYTPALTSRTQDIGTTNDGTWQQSSTGNIPVTDPSTLSYTGAPVPAGAIFNAGTGPITGQPRVGLSTSVPDSGSGFGYLRYDFTTSTTITSISVAAQADDRPHRVWLDSTVIADFSATPGSPNANDPVAYFGVWSPVVTTTISVPAGLHALYYEYDNNVPRQEGGALDARITLADKAVNARAQVVRNCDGSTSLIDIETGQTVPDTATIVTCPTGTSPVADTEVVELCDVAADGTSTPFLRLLTFPASGGAPTVTDTGLDGTTPYTPAGTVGVCPTPAEDPQEPVPCRDTSSTLLCDTATTDLITVFDPANRASSDGWEVVSFTGANPGSGPQAAMPYPAPYGTPFGYPALGARADQSAGTGSGGPWSTYDAAPVRWVLRKTFDAPEDGVAVAQSVGFRGDGGARVRINGIDAGMYGQWNQPATSGTAQIPVTAGPNTVEIEVRDVGGINNVVGRLDVLLPHTTQFMRRQIVVCDTGEVIATHDTTLDGAPYTVTGEVGQCEPAAECCEQPPPEARVDVESDVMCLVAADGTALGQVLVERVYDDQSGDRVDQRVVDLTTGEDVTVPGGASLTVCPAPEPQPCGDTELAALCDLTYDPQAPIPTPAGDFTLTGNVVAANDGTTLWFAQANQEANGVAELTVSGLLPTVLYEFRFASAWIGAGAPTPATNNAIYLLEILDGTTVLATRTRNTSNGSSVFPGGVLSEDLPPLAFIAPATGAVTIRFTDQTTGGPINDRDLFLMPFEVRTAVLTLHRTPFLRRFTLDCDGGLTSTQDLALDGTTPYEVQGEAGTCTGDGSGGMAAPGPDTEVVQLCDVAADGTSTPFLRALTWEPGADTPTVADTALDGVTAYTPAGTVGLCQGAAAAEGRDVELTPMCVVDNNSGGVIQRILAEVIYDTATGDRLSVRYVDPMTWGPVALPGGTHLDLCPSEQPAPEPCRNSSTLLLCDLPTDGTPTATVTDTSPTPYYPYATGSPVAGAQALWDGGTLDLPPGTAPQPGTTGSVNSLAATIAAPRPACDTGIAHLTVSLTVQQAGPDDGCGPTGHLRLFNGSTQAALTVLPANTPNGFFGTLVVEADIPAADLAAGNVAVALALDAYDDSPASCTPSPRHTGWQLSAFTVTATYDQAGCAAQVLANVVTDCESGQVESVTYTTLDGTPYTPTGDVGQCQSAGGGSCCPEQTCPAQNIIETCRCDDTDEDGLPDVGYVELLAVDCQGNLASLGTYTDGLTAPYTPVAPVACDTADETEGAPPVFGVQARRLELAAGDTWDASSIATLQSVTAVAHSGTGTITTADGASTLHTGEAATWSVARDADAALTGPLTITADSGTVTITWTQGVTL